MNDISSTPNMYADRMLMDHWNIQPSAVKGVENCAVSFYKRFLYTKIYSVLKFTLPDDWKVNYFRFWLFHLGTLGVIYTKEFGWIAQPYSITKLDLYYNPKEIMVYNQNLDKVKYGVVGINAGIIKIMDDFYGLDDIVTRYAQELAQCDKSISINLMNANVAALFEAESKKQADEIKEAYGKATTGEPLVVVNKDALGDRQITTLLPHVKDNFVVNDILTSRRTILNAFLTDIGIRNANYEKRERLNSQEVNENNDETKAIISVIFDNIKAGMDEVNKISGLSLNVEYAYDYESKEAQTWQD